MNGARRYFSRITVALTVMCVVYFAPVVSFVLWWDAPHWFLTPIIALSLGSFVAIMWSEWRS